MLLNDAERSFNRKIARQPRFPMEICDETFELVIDILRSIGWSGPVGVACDDTKLFDTWRLYYDAVTKRFYLVGGIDGPILVTNPEKVQELMASLAVKKAKKVSGPLIRVCLRLIAMPGAGVDTSRRVCAEDLSDHHSRTPDPVRDG